MLFHARHRGPLPSAVVGAGIGISNGPLRPRAPAAGAEAPRFAVAARRGPDAVRRGDAGVRLIGVRLVAVRDAVLPRRTGVLWRGRGDVAGAAAPSRLAA